MCPHCYDAHFGSLLLLTCSRLSLVIMLFLFYGSGWKPGSYYKRVIIAFLDLDKQFVGGAVAAGLGTLPYTIVTLGAGATFDSVQRDVDSGHFNAAFVTTPGASSALQSAVRSSSALYDPTAAFTFVFDEGRGGPSMALLLRAAEGVVGGAAAAIITGGLLQMNAGAQVSSLNARVLARPVAGSTLNLHPVVISGLNTVAVCARMRWRGPGHPSKLPV